MEKLSFLLFVFGFCSVHSRGNFRYDNLVSCNISVERPQGASEPRQSKRQVADVFDEFSRFTFKWASSLPENSECKILINDVYREVGRLNLWALKMLDATAKIPSGILSGNLNQFGDFDECLRVKGYSRNGIIQGKYCLANIDVKFDKNQASDEVQKLNSAIHSNWVVRNEVRDQGHRIPKFETFNVGLCIPASCNAQEIETAIGEHLNKLSKFTFINFGVSVSDEVCYVGDEKASSPLKSFAWLIFALIAVLTVAGTLADVNKFSTSNSQLARILSCFSLRRNLALLLKTSSPQDDIKCIHGARFLNAVALLLSHKQMAMLFSPILNRTQMSEFFLVMARVVPLINGDIPCCFRTVGDPFWGFLSMCECLGGGNKNYLQILGLFSLLFSTNAEATCFMGMVGKKMEGDHDSNKSFDKGWTMIGRTAILYTDSFILFSGLLVSYSTIRDLDRKRTMNFKDRFINRIVRLVPNLFGVIFFCTYIMDDMGSGPQWGLVVNKYTNLCKKHMWRNFLFVHNHFGFENMCLTHTHQLGIDMQLFLLSPIFIYLMWKMPKTGTLLLTVAAAASTWLRYDITHRKNLSTLIYYGISVERLWKTANNSYIMPTHRLTVYLTGILLGYYFRRGGRNLKFTFLQATTGWTFAATAALLAVFGQYQAAFKEYVYNVDDAARFNAFAPVLWTVFLTWGLIACSNGSGGILNDFLSWKYFRIFTRISYAVYLTQFPVFFYNVGTERTARYYKGFHSLFDVEEFGLIFIASIVLTLTFDLPFQELKKFISSVLANINNEKIHKSNENDETQDDKRHRERRRLQSFGT